MPTELQNFETYVLSKMFSIIMKNSISIIYFKGKVKSYITSGIRLGTSILGNERGK